MKWLFYDRQKVPLWPGNIISIRDRRLSYLIQLITLLQLRIYRDGLKRLGGNKNTEQQHKHCNMNLHQETTTNNNTRTITWVQPPPTDSTPFHILFTSFLSFHIVAECVKPLNKKDILSSRHHGNTLVSWPRVLDKTLIRDKLKF